MNCPRCHGKEHHKSGFAHGRQRHKCKSCGYNYTTPTRSRFPESVKRRAIQLYMEGLGLRSIGRHLGVSQVSVMRWVKLYGRDASRLRAKQPPESSGDIALDEMWHYVSKKNGSCGYGLLLTDKKTFLLTLNSETGGV